MIGYIMSNFNNYKYDYLTITFTTEKVDEMIKIYNDFLWEEVSKAKNKDYEDVYYVTLRRPHFIENKDRLQYLQVVMEEKINKLGKQGATKHFNSVLFSSLTGAIILFALALSLYVICTINNTLLIALCGVLGATSILVIPFIIRRTIKLVKKENERFYSATTTCNSQINDIISEVKSLTKENNL